ncbi:MAG: hypothetical protein IID07_14705 [Gemmatimonadetes bacterium]|nr:hypothetical protein [Gemmatimonadota bacterium]
MKKIGRPRIIESPAEMERLVAEYVTKCQDTLNTRQDWVQPEENNMVTTKGSTAGVALGAYEVPTPTDESSRLVHGFVSEQYDLGVLARQYLEDIHATRCVNEEETGSSIGERVTAFALGRLAAIGSILGRDELGRALAAATEEGNAKPLLDEILDLVTKHAGEGNGVNDEEHVVKAFVPTVQELAVLARHYLDEVNDFHMDWWIFNQGGSGRFCMFAAGRLNSIHDALGCDAHDAAVKSTVAKWRKKVAEIKVEGIRCGECGVLRTVRDCPICGPSTDPEAADPWDLPGIWLTCK